jgi:micrococcal nuclease
VATNTPVPIVPTNTPQPIIPTDTPLPEPTWTWTPEPQTGNCDPAYPDFCIAPPPPDLNCKDLAPHKKFRVLPPDPHGFDKDGDGIGCES